MLKFKGRLMVLIAILISQSLLVVQPVDAESRSSEDVGDVLQLVIPAAAYATTYVLGDEQGRSQFYKSFLTNEAVTYALKYTVNRDRPDGNGNHSFPSGHTSAAFQGAAFIHYRYGLKYALPAYAGASFVGWSRVEGEADKHYWSDVAAGAVIGTLSSWYFTDTWCGVKVIPVVNSKEVSLNFSMSW